MKINVFMRELRILSGLQAGARLTVSERSYVIGRGEECDVLVVGHGIDETALQLAISQDAIIATPLQPGCGFELTDSMTEPFTLSLGQPFRIGDLWLGVDAKEAPWPSQQSWLPAAKPLELLIAEPSETSAIVSDDQEYAAVGPTETPRRGYWHWFAMICALIFLCGGAVVYLLQPAASASTIATPPSTLPSNASKELLDSVDSVNSAPSVVVRPTSLPLAMPAVSASDAAEEFKMHLAEHQLAERLEVTLDGTAMRITGELDSSQTQEFETLLVAFTKKYGYMLAITAHFPPPARHLPFHIKQVVSGHPAHVVTSDGIRIFEGGSFHGYRLVAITDRKIIFSGQRSVELEW